MGSDNSNVIEVKPVNADGTDVKTKGEPPMTPKDKKDVSIGVVSCVIRFDQAFIANGLVMSILSRSIDKLMPIYASFRLLLA